MRNVIPFPEHEQEEYPRVEPGAYALRFTHWETKRRFNTGKVSVWFEVVSYGEAFGVRLARHYNAKHLIGKLGKKGGFYAGKCSDLAREFYTVMELAGEPVGKFRPDRLPLHLLGSHVVVGVVRDVKHDSKRKPIPQALQYSVVDELKGIKPP
ncbi:hypothetical protein [Thiothrix winogradskyi]|uniref:Uncharacterized protein n=1 Tax=Thiothrix winogradskyi TaxID=96472 RepID=A0ABY3T600_9GAMM|nr:hypothetical protein [Thiothrix winogradskyi]UJS26055.1 hypothetical protein L2Y54_08450 [Thiothrix winogradskyi]